jgi:hypothetical protein
LERPFGARPRGSEQCGRLHRPKVQDVVLALNGAHLLDAYHAYSDAQGIDLCIGRRTHRLFRAAGVVDISVDAIAHVFPAHDPGRMILHDFINNVREKLIGQGFIERADLERDMASIERHLSNPEVLVTSHLFYRLSGRAPPSG